MNAITQDYNEYYVLVTAYYVDIEHEYENYLKNSIKAFYKGKPDVIVGLRDCFDSR